MVFRTKCQRGEQIVHPSGPFGVWRVVSDIFQRNVYLMATQSELRLITCLKRTIAVKIGDGGEGGKKPAEGFWSHA